MKIGIVQFVAPKGTIPHRTLGWIWVALMLVVAISAFWIQHIRMWGPWSPIHLLAVFTLINVPLAVLHARGVGGIKDFFVAGATFAG